MKYFGTDGIRGVFGGSLTVDLAYKTGYAIGKFFAKTIVVGRDTRVSGQLLEEFLCKGILDAGANIILVGILPTPAISFLVKKYRASAGVMLTASHNPPAYNGIKIFNEFGTKLNDEDETVLEQIIDDKIIYAINGNISRAKKAKKDYINYVVGLARELGISLKGQKILLDCASGASIYVAMPIFKKLGAKVTLINAENEGEKINESSGATCPDAALSEAKKQGIQLAFAYDGDADRVTVCYEGEIIDGDSVMYNLAKVMKLNHNTVVGTVLSNLSLEEKLKEKGIKLVRTNVGDKYVSDEMLKNGYNLGGEQSGHFIISPFSLTGDGILASLFFSKIVMDNKFEKLKLLPQNAIAIETPKTILDDADFINLIKETNDKLGDDGRLVARYSGTEPKIRIMCEATSKDIVKETLDVFETFLNSKK